MKFLQPPLLKNSQGQIRKAGFEFEYSGISLDEASRIIQEIFGGEQLVVNRFAYKVLETEYGEFKIEMDSRLFKNKEYQKYLDKLGIDYHTFIDQGKIEDLLEKVAETVVPYEIITPPIPLNKFGNLNKLQHELYRSRAKGTTASLLYAFGLHINPEVPDTKVETLLGILKAFIILYPWIYVDSEIDFSRRVVPFIDEFPEEYCRKILNREYKPDLSTFIRGYLADNPTRNRPLDLLPILTGIDERIPEIIEDSITEARPAFHYRLPNCRIDDRNWSMAQEWNYWVIVERLAEFPDKINRLSDAYLDMLESSVFQFKANWHRWMNSWLEKEKISDH